MGGKSGRRRLDVLFYHPIRTRDCIWLIGKALLSRKQIQLCIGEFLPKILFMCFMHVLTDVQKGSASLYDYLFGPNHAALALLSFNHDDFALL